MQLTKLALALPFLLLACDNEPSGPKGPSGGENRFRVTIGEELEPFDEVDLEVQTTSTGTATIYLSGSVDPLKNAVDDEYSLQLQVDLDRAALVAMTPPESLEVKGTASFTPGETAGGFEVVDYEADPSSSGIVKRLFFRRSCFCADQSSGEQSFDGTIQVTQVSDDEITGTLEIRLTGDVPNYDGELDATLSAEFNLAIP